MNLLILPVLKEVEHEVGESEIQIRSLRRRSLEARYWLAACFNVIPLVSSDISVNPTEQAEEGR